MRSELFLPASSLRLIKGFDSPTGDRSVTGLDVVDAPLISNIKEPPIRRCGLEVHGHSRRLLTA